LAFAGGVTATIEQQSAATRKWENVFVRRFVMDIQGTNIDFQALVSITVRVAPGVSQRYRAFTAAAIFAIFITLVEPVSAKSFRNCAEVKRSYPNGVAINFAASGRSRAEINRDIYLKNQALDRDRDGVICESELLQNPPTTTSSTIPRPCSQGGWCGLGERGPGGGIIFYAQGAESLWGHALEAAPLITSLNAVSTQDPVAPWGCRGKSIPEANGRAIGTGALNTRAIVRDCQVVGTAAWLAENLVLNGKDDWFLPSLEELRQLYIRRNLVGDLSPRGYQTSTERSAEQNDVGGFQDGIIGGGGWKDHEFAVRPIRYVKKSHP
jgi:hypothetical protein